jgi:uncharacterized membrane protein
MNAYLKLIALSFTLAAVTSSLSNPLIMWSIAGFLLIVSSIYIGSIYLLESVFRTMDDTIAERLLVRWNKDANFGIIKTNLLALLILQVLSLSLLGPVFVSALLGYSSFFMVTSGVLHIRENYLTEFEFLKEKYGQK